MLGPAELSSRRQRLDHRADIEVAEALEHARIEQEAQRHAWERSSRSASASTPRAAATWRSRRGVARRSASFTVSLIVVVPSSARAAPSALSSRSSRCLATPPVYTPWTSYSHGKMAALVGPISFATARVSAPRGCLRNRRSDLPHVDLAIENWIVDLSLHRHPQLGRQALGASVLRMDD